MRIIIYILIACSSFSCSNTKSSKEFYSTGETKYIVTEFENKVCSTEFYKSGVTKREACSKNGLLEGKVITYYENGTHEYEIDYNNGIKNGKVVFYSEEGTPIVEQFWFEDNNYYSIFYDSLGKVTADLLNPVVTELGKMKSNQLSKIEIYIPFNNEFDLPYKSKDISVLWNLSKVEGTSEFYFNEKKDSVLQFNSRIQTNFIEVAPRDTGNYYLNLLVYHDLVDSLFEFSSTEFNFK